MKKIAIVQSNYIPWKGYFDLIAAVDEFILYDDMQYTRRDWRNRNKIKTPQGIQWITIPIQVKGKYYQKIKNTKIAGMKWTVEHWKALTHNYQRAPYFNEIALWLKPLYLTQTYSHLSQLNRTLIEAICAYLQIETVISNSWEYKLIPGKTKRLVDLCAQAGGTHYLSGPSAKYYLDENLFPHQDIQLSWFDYQNYPDYPQLWGNFTHEVTILDLLFNFS
jgi:hypothetical protein